MHCCISSCLSLARMHARACARAFPWSLEPKEVQLGASNDISARAPPSLCDATMGCPLASVAAVSRVMRRHHARHALQSAAAAVTAQRSSAGRSPQQWDARVIAALKRQRLGVVAMRLQTVR